MSTSRSEAAGDGLKHRERRSISVGITCGPQGQQLIINVSKEINDGLKTIQSHTYTDMFGP